MIRKNSNMKNKNLVKTSKEDFIAFLASMTPAEINKFIEEKGKPKRMIDPMFFYPPRDE